jgi:hypothetical protein
METTVMTDKEHALHSAALLQEAHHGHHNTCPRANMKLGLIIEE